MHSEEILGSQLCRRGVHSLQRCWNELILNSAGPDFLLHTFQMEAIFSRSFDEPQSTNLWHPAKLGESDNS